jgi:hypothetical protein
MVRRSLIPLLALGGTLSAGTLSALFETLGPHPTPGRVVAGLVALGSLYGAGVAGGRAVAYHNAEVFNTQAEGESD